MDHHNILQRPSQERLLAQAVELTTAADQGLEHGNKSRAQVVAGYTDETLSNDPGLVEGREEIANGGGRHTEYKVFKRRWFGLAQLVLLNIIVSWDVISNRTGMGCSVADGYVVAILRSGE